MNKYSETFQNIDGYDNYAISNYGNVKNTVTNIILKPLVKKMREYVRLVKDGIITCYNIDELVCTYFLRQYDGECIFHRDKDIHNCHVSNLSFRKKAEAYKYLIYFETLGKFRACDSETNEITTYDILPRTANTFYVFDGYEKTDDSLLQFANDFKQWCKELSNNDILKIVCQKYGTHYMAVENTFKRLCKNYDSMKVITPNEDKILDKTNNGGLQSFNEKFANMIINSFGYDFSANFPTILQMDTMLIPTCEPTETILKELPKRKNIKLGIYHVKITSNDKRFNHVFAYSHEHYYTSISLKYALKQRRQFNVKIELINDNETNAYIYDEYVTGRSVFGEWYDKLIQIKNLYPKNNLVKHLLSSVWGMITHRSIINKTYDDIEKEKLNIGEDYEVIDIVNCGKKNEYYELISTKNNLYKYNIRIKPFLTAYSRVNIANVILDGDNLDYFVRAHTDNSVFTKPIDYKKFAGLNIEEKTSGMIKWNKCNDYKKV